MNAAFKIQTIAAADSYRGKLVESEVQSPDGSLEVDVFLDTDWYRVSLPLVTDASELFMALLGEGAPEDASRIYSLVDASTLRAEDGAILSIRKLAENEPVLQTDTF